MYSNPRRQRGIALLMAMLVVSIATITAVSLVHEQSFSVRKTGNLQRYQSAMLYAVGLEDYARLFLNKDAKDSKIDHLGEDWAIGVPALPIEGGVLSGMIIDEQSRLNINNLAANAESRQQMRRLCESLEVNPDFVSALVDWIDENVEAEIPDGAEDDYYTALETPYRTANRPMTDVSELLLVKGVDAKIYQTLRPYLTALPETTPLNLNTMPVQLLDALSLDKDGAAIIEARESAEFTSLEDFSKRMEIVLDEKQKKELGVATKFFLATGVVTLNEKSLTIRSLLKRDDQGKTQVLQRSLGDML